MSNFIQLQDHLLNDSPDLCDEDCQNVSDLAERTPRWPCGMFHGYYNGRLVLIVHVLLRGIHDEVGDFCATFYSACVVADFHGDQFAAWECEAKLPLADICHNHIEQPVLIEIVEFAEKAEQGRKLLVRSIVRLCSLDSCSRAVTDRRESIGLLGEVFGTAGNWELEFVVPWWRTGPALPDGNRVNQAIETGAQVVNAVSSDQRPSVIGSRFGDFEDLAVAAA